MRILCILLFLKPVFSALFVKFFAKEIRTLLNFDKVYEKSFLKKKRFHPFKRHLQQNWRAEVAGRLVLFFRVKMRR